MRYDWPHAHAFLPVACLKETIGEDEKNMPLFLRGASWLQRASAWGRSQLSHLRLSLVAASSRFSRAIRRVRFVTFRRTATSSYATAASSSIGLSMAR